MGLSGSIRKLARKARATLHRLPAIGPGARYAERLVLLPWNFHKHDRAAGEFQARLYATLLDQLHAQQAAYADAMRAQTEGLSAHLANVVRDTLARLVADHLERAVAEPVERMLAEF